MMFVGAIKFVGSVERQDRFTRVMSFAIGSDWFESVKDMYTEEVRTGSYDGRAIIVKVYEVKAPVEVFAESTDDMFVRENLIESHTITNLYDN